LGLKKGKDWVSLPVIIRLLAYSFDCLMSPHVVVSLSEGETAVMPDKPFVVFCIIIFE